MDVLPFLHRALPDQLLLYLLDILSNSEVTPAVFIKSRQKNYLYVNKNFELLFGRKNLVGKNDYHVTSDVKLIQAYHERDDMAMELEQMNEVSELVAPSAYKNLIKNVRCLKLPLCIHSDKPDAVLGVAIPENRFLVLDANAIFSTSLKRFDRMLTRKNYVFSLAQDEISVTRRELLCLLGVIQGKSAAEIAEYLSIQVRTVEFYIQTLKGKCAVSKKSELIDFFFENKLFCDFAL